MQSKDGVKLNRININVEDSVKKWYQIKARSMGMNMTQLMSYVVANYCTTQKQAETLQQIGEISKNENIREDNVNMLNLIVEMLNQINDVGDGE